MGQFCLYGVGIHWGCRGWVAGLTRRGALTTGKRPTCATLGRKTTEPNYCIDCGKRIEYRAKRCRQCAGLGGRRKAINKLRADGECLVDSQCVDCGKPISFISTRCPSCSIRHHWMAGVYADRNFNGDRNPHWRGGHKHNQGGGYVMVQDYRHPMASPHGYLREHRKVMAAIVGRPLKHTEVVHHINGDRTDNRPENLMLFPSNGAHARYHHRLREEG